VPNRSTGSSMGYISYPVWYTVAISGIIVACRFTFVLRGGLTVNRQIMPKSYGDALIFLE